ncbi:MAG: hypothetical protein AABY50_07800 [Nitrospirota bacterium]
MNIELLLNHASRHKAVYFLGAGASAGLMPTMRDVPLSSRQKVKDYGSFDINSYPDTEYRNCLNLSTENLDLSNMDDCKVKHTNEPALKLAYDRSFIDVSCKIVCSGEVPQQYRFFNLVPICPAIITLNTDAIVNYVRHIRIVELHGSVLTYENKGRLFHRSYKLIKNWVTQEEDGVVEFGIRVFEPVIVRPGEAEKPELKSMWDAAYKFLRMAEAIFVIGYSFPIYDEPVRQLFISTLKGRHCPIHVIDFFNAYEVAEKLREHLKQSSVFAWQLDWRAFSKAVWQIAYASKKFIIADLQPLSKVILKKYSRVL